VGGLDLRLGEDDGDRDAMPHEHLGQLDHRREVADERTRVQNHGLVHMFGPLLMNRLFRGLST
jgi:hypothetical protein